MQRSNTDVWVGMLVLLGAAALLFLASGRTWVTLLVTDPGLPSLTVAITGSQLTYGAPLALLALAARRSDGAAWGSILRDRWLPAALGTAPEGLASTGDPLMCTLWTFLGMPALSLPTMSVGVPAGATTPNQPRTSKSGQPCSAMGTTSGSARERSFEVMPMGRSVPA